MKKIFYIIILSAVLASCYHKPKEATDIPEDRADSLSADTTTHHP